MCHVLTYSIGDAQIKFQPSFQELQIGTFEFTRENTAQMQSGGTWKKEPKRILDVLPIWQLGDDR